jgi:hypothetical protein
MSVTKIITLTNKGNAAGPYYEVSCSNDCVTYGACITTGSIYLPTIGSIANVNIYDTTTCIKLVNHNTDCNNAVIHSFAASGSTTTTSTSTTSTTTTTTTMAPCCLEYNIDRCAGGGCSVTYIPCSGSYEITQTIPYSPTPQNIKICAAYNSPITTTGTFNIAVTRICSGCSNCTTCYTYRVTNTGCGGYPSTFYYTDCTTGVVTAQTVNPSLYVDVCSSTTPDISSGCFTSTNLGVCNVNCGTTTTTTTTAASGIRAGTSYTQVCSGAGSSVSTITYIGGTTICNATTISALTFNTMSAGTYWMYEPTLGYVEYYKSGGFGTSTMDRVGVGCTACSTTTSTTTTTTAAPIYYYNVTRFRCFPCGQDAIDLIASSPVALVNNIYYNNGDGYVYYTNYSTGAGYVDVDLAGSAADAICSSACSI